MEGETPRPANIVSLLRDSLPTEEELVRVHFDAGCFNRKTNPTQEEAIASQWRRKCRQNPRLFNGSKFRYAGLQWSTSNAPTIQLGLTNYRDHIGTNCGGGAALLQQAGETVHGDRQAFLADPLGVGALVLTSDNRLVLVKRALWTGEYPGHVDRPGGHAEPDEVLRDGSDSAEQDVLCDDRDDAVRREVFESIRREIRDELGVPMQHLSRAYLVGALRDEAMGGRPTLEFVVRCSLPCSEVQRLYDEGKHSEADESLGLIFFTKDELFGERAVFKVPDLSEVTHEKEPVRTNQARSPATEVSCDGGTECAGSAACVEDPIRPEGEAHHAYAAVVANGPTALALEQAGSTAQNSGQVSEETPATGTTTAPQSGKPPPSSAQISKPEKKRRRHRKDKRHAATNKSSVASDVQQSVTRSKESKSVTGLESADGADQPDVEGKKAGSNHTSEAASTNKVTTGNARSEPTAAETDSSVLNSTTASKSSTAQITEAASNTAKFPPPPTEGVDRPVPVSASEPEMTVSSSNDQIVVVQRDGVVLFQSEGEVTETTMPAASSGRMETLAEVSNPNPEAAQGADESAEKTPEELERQRKGEIWEKMTPACRAAIVLLKEMNLKGFVFRF